MTSDQADDPIDNVVDATDPTLARPQVPRVVIGIAAAAAVGAVVILGISRAADHAELRSTLRRADWAWLAGCAAGQLLVFGGYAGAIRSAVQRDEGPVISFASAVRVAVAGFALTQLVAAGGVAGLAFSYWVLRRLGLDRRHAAIRLIGLNAAVYLVFAVIGWAAALAVLGGSAGPLAMTIPWLMLVPAVVVAARWFTAPGRVARWTTPSGAWLRRGLATGVAAAAWVREGVGTAAGRQLAGRAALYWAGDVISLGAALAAFGAVPTVDRLLLAYCTGYLAQLVPVPFIATGGVDAATTFALVAVGVPIEVALLGVTAHRVFAFWIPIGPGLIAAGRLSRPAYWRDEVSRARRPARRVATRARPR